MSRLRNRLITAFLIATLAPLAVIVTISIALLQHSLSLATTRDLDEISRSLEQTGRELYQRTGEALKRDAVSGRATAVVYSERDRAAWPAAVQDFAASSASERFALSGNAGERLDYLVKRGHEIRVYSTSLNGVAMKRIAQQYARARAAVEAAGARDVRRGHIYPLVILASAIWIVALAIVIFWAHRVSNPIRQLTDGLSAVAAGRLEHRVQASRDDEIGTAIAAFNHMAQQLQESRERLVYMTRLESWQALARKMAHEVKNSLTPIRLTMEEVAARRSGADDAFLQQASQIVVDEVMALERRVRAFAEFASEPPMQPRELDINSLLQERVSFLRTAHPEIVYDVRLSRDCPRAVADEDLVKGMLTNLLENAAHAAQHGGVVLGITKAVNGRVAIEVHDSGPGLSEQVQRSLFEPTISFKPGGMGLGLSIARRSAVLSGGDIELVAGELGGAGFRVLLPRS